MKILKFETKDHPILGNCTLDFSQNGLPSDIVVIAGSNGSGKTTILDELFKFLTIDGVSSDDYDITVTFKLSPEEISILNSITVNIGEILTIKSSRIPSNGARNWTQIKAMTNGIDVSNIATFMGAFRGLLKCVYSTVEINFGKQEVSSTTALDIDNVVVPKEKSQGDISLQMAQLLVDIKALDDSDAAEWMRSHHGAIIDITQHHERISRFKNAFDYMIEGKTFEGVKNEKGRKKVYFKDPFGNEIDISDLSSGEKQIVFRAGYLLKNIGTLQGGIILIDEPEISFHPSWQEKYVEFIRKMFSNNEGIMQTQIVIATHSPFIVQNENIVEEKIIILQKHGKDTIESVWPKFYGYTNPEPIFIPLQLTAKPLVLVEGESDKRILTFAWKKLYPNQDMYFEIKWAGEPNPAGGAGLLQRQLITLQQHSTQKVIGLFDGDAKGLNEHKGTRTKQLIDFALNSSIQSLKTLNKVGVTYLPTPVSRTKYFNLSYPEYSMLTLELFFSDLVLGNFNILESDPVRLGGEEFVKIKANHSISEEDLNSLFVIDFNEFILIFDHLEACFNQIQ